MKKCIAGLLLVTVGLALALGAVWAQEKKPLTNQDILDMYKARFDERTIMTAIDNSPTAFDTSVQALIFLKNAGISESVISAMLAAGKGGAGGAPAHDTSAGLPDEIGIYALQAGKWIEVSAELVNWQTGGVLKRIGTIGITKGHINGRVNGPESRIRLAPPLEFIIVTYEGVSAMEYQLVRMDKKGDRREFRQWTGGVLHASSGAHENAVAFEAEKVKSRTYRVTIDDLKKGEYGFLPPIGPISSSATASGRVYTFRVAE